MKNVDGIEHSIYIFGKLDFELVVGLTFPGVFEVQIWAPKMVISENMPNPG